MFNNRTLKIVFVGLVVVIMAIAVYALAAANTVPATKAGAGAGVISGYTVTNIAYDLDDTDPTLLDAVEFDLSAAAETVTIKLIAAGSTWYSCTNVLLHWTCTAADVPLSTIDELEVVAVENTP